MKKFLLLFLMFLFVQNTGFSKDVLQFDFPNEGWHKISSPDGIESKKCYVPVNQTLENYTEMLTFTEKTVKNLDITPIVILQKQLGKDRNNYPDIIPEYINQDMDDAMIAWCSQYRNTCVVERAFKGNDGIILAIYTNKAPHYSQNMFGQWSNILSKVSIYKQDNTSQMLQNLIEL